LFITTYIEKQCIQPLNDITTAPKSPKDHIERCYQARRRIFICTQIEVIIGKEYQIIKFMVIYHLNRKSKGYFSTVIIQQ